MVSDLGKANLAKSGSKPTQYICCSTIPQILYFQQQNISFPACFSFIRRFFPQSTQFLHNSWMTSHWGKSKWISSRRPEQCAWHRATALHQSILYFRSSKDKSLIVYLKYHFSWTSNFEHIWWMKSRRKEFWWEGKWCCNDCRYGGTSEHGSKEDRGENGFKKKVPAQSIRGADCLLCQSALNKCLTILASQMSMRFEMHVRGLKLFSWNCNKCVEMASRALKVHQEWLKETKFALIGRFHCNIVSVRR